MTDIEIDDEAMTALLTVFKENRERLDGVLPKEYRDAAAGHLTIAYTMVAKSPPCPKCGHRGQWLQQMDEHNCLETGSDIEVEQTAGD